MLQSQENGLFDLSDYEHIEDKTFPPFPPRASPGRQNGEEAEPDEESGSGAPVVPPKRTVKRNIPKLNAQRSTSERGLPALRNFFDKAKFKGKGCEAEDLKMLIRHMEHWALRLFPKLQFEDFIERVEYLGNKESDEVGENNGHDISATELDPFLINSSASDNFASESNRSLTEEQQERTKRNKHKILERRQAKLLSNSLGNDMLMNTQIVEEVNTGEDQEESNGLNKDIL
uniref:TIMELESS-interacting protein n=1 Tax=Otolemur garnettii TaxID=30611 RepID=H0XH71_OTOGA